MRRQAAVLGTILILLSGCGAAADSAPPPNSHGSPPSQGQLKLIEKLNDQAWLAVVGLYPGAVRPQVEVARVIELEDWGSVMTACLEDAGFPDVVEIPGGGITPGEMPVSQLESYAVAQWACAATYPVDPRYTTALSEDQLKALYAYFVGDLTECLEAEGYAVSAPPSESTFVETYDETHWSPYADVPPGGSQEAWDTLNQTCPQVPEDLY